jgi:hypothetical protein
VSLYPLDTSFKIVEKVRDACIWKSCGQIVDKELLEVTFSLVFCLHIIISINNIYDCSYIM